MRFETLSLDLARPFWHEFSQVQDTRPRKDYLNLLKIYADLGAKVTFARQRASVIGTMMFLPAFKLNGVASTPGLAEVIKTPGEVAVQANIFIAPEHRGKGLSPQLDHHCRAAARKEGFTHFLGIFYETEEIKSWWMRSDDSIFTGLYDEFDDPIHLLPLELL